MRPYRVSFDALPPDGAVFLLEFPPNDINATLGEAGFPGVGPAGPLRAELRLVPTDGEVLAFGNLRLRVAYRCVRCLEPFEEELAETLRLNLGRRGEPAGDPTPHSEAFELEAVQGGEVDLTELVKEQLYLALRPHPVCSESCRGLCPGCGADLNTSGCGCTQTRVDPRFAALEKLSKKG